MVGSAIAAIGNEYTYDEQKASARRSLLAQLIQKLSLQYFLSFTDHS